jgi:tetratricopeptide (TPR) repeat protein
MDAFAEAWWQLGYLDAEAALGGRDARAAERALSAYERAHALAPFNQKYVLSAGYQALALHDLDRAAALFTSSYDTDPTSVHALVGLGDIALQRGHRARALSYLQRARHLDATSPDVAQLAHRLGE